MIAKNDDVNNLQSIPIINREIDIKGDTLVLQLRADWHYGVENVNLKYIKDVCIQQHKLYGPNLFPVYGGDLAQSNVIGSKGHPFDLTEPDPNKQIRNITGLLAELDADYKTRRKDAKCKKQPSSVGVLGNHEYRFRKVSGLWVDDMYEHASVDCAGLECLINLKITSGKKIRTYKVYLTHKLGSSSAASVQTLQRLWTKKMGVISADVYLVGHYHYRRILTSHYYDNNGIVAKRILAVAPSPMHNVEYATVEGYDPISSGIFVNVYLPIEGNPYSTV